MEQALKKRVWKEELTLNGERFPLFFPDVW